MYTTCPKCEYIRKPEDQAGKDVCPGCGLVFSKWMKQQFTSTQTVRESSIPGGLPDPSGRIKTIVDYLMYAEEKVNPFYFWGRVAVFAGVLVWGWQFIMMDFTENPYEINNSFMHTINLVFHEAGHVVFRPFGWFITILGGSLGQLIMPAVIMIAFLWKHHNTFGASIGLWWLGQSFIDLSPYIDDAYVQQLVLLGGKTGSDAPGSHDWNNILAEFDMIDKHRTVATFADTIGCALIVTALVWGGYILYKQYQNMG